MKWSHPSISAGSPFTNSANLESKYSEKKVQNNNAEINNKKIKIEYNKFLHSIYVVLSIPSNLEMI